MHPIISNTKSYRPHPVTFIVFLCIYLALGIQTNLLFIEANSVPEDLLEDFGYYERALDDAIDGNDPYSIRSIGPGFLYPPPALFIVEAFHNIKPFYFKFLVYSAFNIALLILIVAGTARYYGYPTRRVWYWYVFCLGFAPFFELLYLGQINIITLFGIFMLFFWLDSSQVLSGFGFSLAIFTKVSPIILLGYLVATKKFRIIAVTLVWMAAIIVLCVLRYGVSPVLLYPGVLQWLSNQFPIDYNSQSFVSKLVMAFGSIFQDSEPQIIQGVLTLYIFFIIAASSLLTMAGRQPKEPLFIVTIFGMTILPNVLWYHHYVFILLPMLVWMGWKHLDLGVATWCLLGLTIIQVDRYLTYGSLIHIFTHVSILLILLWQTQQFLSQRKTQDVQAVSQV